MMDIIVRGYAAQDLVACRALWAELTQHHRDIYGDPTIGGDDPGAYFDATYLNMDGLRGPWVAERGGHVIGLTGLFVHGTRGDVEPVVVANNQRSQGIGTALMAHVVAEARVHGIHLLTVRPVARNAEAIAFFVREGFMALGQIDLTQDLSGTYEERWKPGVMLHDHDLKY